MRRTKRTHVVTVLAGLVFSVAMLIGLMFFAGFWRLGSSYTISAYVSNARGIAQDSTVFEAGLPVGLVTGVQRSGPDAILTLRIDHGPTPVPVDSKIQLGLRSLAGEADVFLNPGHSSQMIRNGGSLGLAQDQSYTEVDQILNQLAGPTEGRARQFFQGFGAGLNGEGVNLNHTLGAFASLVNNSPPLTSTLAAQRQQVADIVQNFANIMNAIGQRTQALDEFARGASSTFQAMAARDLTLTGFVEHLPAVLGTVAPVTYPRGAGPGLKTALTPYSLTTVEGGGTNITRELGVATPPAISLVNNLTTAMQQLKPAVDLLTPGSTSGIKVLSALGGASPALKHILVGLEQLQPSAAEAFPALHSLMCQANPVIRFLSPYGKDLGAFFGNFGAAMDPYGAAGGHQMLTSAVVDPTAIVRGVETQPVSNALTTLFNFGLFKAVGGTIGYHALPPPGHRADTSIGAGDHGPIQYGATHPYPHVTADCSK
jgi:phospholipid/cholesterol/gamma-HCH transport system substrate-binding protein